MIVKNEAHVLARALRSVLGFIDHWVICDTGSTDETPSVILESLAHIPGTLHRREWVNFGHNRSELLELARPHADYLLMIDADMEVCVHREFRSLLKADAYDIRYEGAVDYSQPMLFASRHEWKFVGTTHEYARSETAASLEPLPALTLRHYGDGGSREDKYLRDIALLLKAHEEEPSNPRTLFYLAQSYRDIDRWQDALHWYRARVSIESGWDEERWYAAYQVGKILDVLGAPTAEVTEALLAAYQLRPSRLEPLYALVQRAREREEFSLGHLFAATRTQWGYPADRLFVERPVYEYLFALEAGICALHTGHHSTAVRGFNDVLAAKQTPNWVADAAIRGRRVAIEAQRARKRSVFMPRSAKQSLKIIVPFHNPGHFLDNCVESLLRQSVSDFQVVFIDDGSTDNSSDSIVSDSRFTLLRNEARMGAAFSIHRALALCEPQDIVVHVDGDDWLAVDDALAHILEIYRDQDCWVLYGQFRYADGSYGISAPYADASEFAQLRRSWRSSHIRSYRAGLFQQIAEQDPSFECLKSEDGSWLASAVDAAVMFPLLEMAGHERTAFCERVLYVYNDANPQSHHTVDRNAQLQNFLRVQAMRPFRCAQTECLGRVS